MVAEVFESSQRTLVWGKMLSQRYWGDRRRSLYIISRVDACDQFILTWASAFISSGASTVVSRPLDSTGGEC